MRKNGALCVVGWRDKSLHPALNLDTIHDGLNTSMTKYMGRGPGAGHLYFESGLPEGNKGLYGEKIVPRTLWVT